MLVIEKRIGSVAVSVSVTNDKRSVRVRGEVYPFAHRFHSVRFRVHSRNAGEVEGELGFSGSSQDLEASARMIEAAQIAHSQASYYKDLMKALSSNHYAEVMSGLVDGSDPASLIDALALTPGEISDENIERVLGYLRTNASNLGIKGGLTAEAVTAMDDDALYALQDLVCRHSKYESDGGDIDRTVAALIGELFK